MKSIQKFLPYILIIFLSLFAVLPLLNPGFFPIHDDTQVARIFEMAKSLSSGMFPVRWVSDLGFGYGYPIFNYYAPLAYYIGGFINLLGLNALDATKLTMILGIIVSALSMYVFSKEFFGKAGGVLSALLYMYAPYHAVDIYVRGDIAEFYAYAFIPFLFYGIYKISTNNSFKYIALSAISLTIITLSHNLTALMILPFALIFGLVFTYKNPKNVFRLVSSLFFGVVLSAFYVFPALLEMNYTNVLSQVGGGANFSDHFVCLSQLWASAWGYGGSAKGCVDGISFMIGKTHILLASLTILLIIIFQFRPKFKKIFEDKFKIVLTISIFALISVFLMLDFSKPVWEILKPMAFFQYPWRFLIVTVFTLSFVPGFLLFILNKFIKRKLFIVLSILIFVAIIFMNMKFFVPQKLISKNSSDYTNLQIIEWNTSKISSEYMPKGFEKPNNINQLANFNLINSSDLLLISVSKKVQQVDMSVLAKKNTSIIVPVAYFPAWKAYLDKKETKIYGNKKGILMNIPEGKHMIRLSFDGTRIELISDLITLAGLLYVTIAIIYTERRKNEKI